MAFLPERHRRSHPRHGRPPIDLDDTEWRIAIRRARSRWWGIFYVLCIAAGIWLVWEIHDAIYSPVRPYVPSAQTPDYGAPRQPNRYAQPWDPVGPNFENWGNRNHSGVVPRDVFGLNRDGGR